LCVYIQHLPILSFHLSPMLYNPTELVRRKGTSFEAMTDRTAPSSEGLLAEVFLSCKADLCTAPRIISLSPLSLANDMTDATFGASGLWLRTRTGAGSTATLTKSCSIQQLNRDLKRKKKISWEEVIKEQTWEHIWMSLRRT
jgi:hypothetical protein